MKHIIHPTLIGFLFCCLSTATAYATGLTEVDKVFSEIKPTEPGCAVGIIHKGRYIHKAGYGLANLEYQIPIDADSVFRTGSVSKQFTAMAIALLSESGKLDLDADVHTYLPDLKDYGTTVTIRQMIHHLAGMGDYDLEVFQLEGKPFRFGNEDYWTTEEFYDRVKQADLILPPGTKWEYSNLAYFLLAQIVERVSGMTLQDYASENIFKPLGMSNSLFNDDVNRIIPHRADGYLKKEDGTFEIFMTNLDWVGDGGVYTSLNDFIHWDQNFYHNKLGKGEDSLIELVTTPHPDALSSEERNEHYAFGMAKGEIDGDTHFSHSGGWVAFSSYYRRFPDLELSIVVFCNTTEQYAAPLALKVSDIARDRVKAMKP